MCAGGEAKHRNASKEGMGKHTVTWILLSILTGNCIVQAEVHNNGGNNDLLDTVFQQSEPTLSPAEPYFDVGMARNVTATVGKTAYFGCRVFNLGNKTVSWIRHRDLHILTVGSYTYTTDQRFQASHQKESNEWTLQIKWAQKRDSGMYECQISTQPVKSFFVNLNIVGYGIPSYENDSPMRWQPPSRSRTTLHDEIYHTMYADQAVPTARILGGPDLHVDKGSTINLTCTIRFSPDPPAFIFWYHQGEVINFNEDRSGVSVVTEKGELLTTSILLVRAADLADSGKYSCSPSNADVASIRVHVLDGEIPAAMQTGSAGISSSGRYVLGLFTLSAIYHHATQYLRFHR